MPPSSSSAVAKGTSLACAGGVVCEEVVSTATPAPEDLELLSYYRRDISLVVKGEGLQGGGGGVVSGSGGSVDGVQGAADRRDGQPVPGFGEVRQAGPGPAGYVIDPDGAEHGAEALPTGDDQLAADDRRAGVADLARRGRQLDPPVSGRVEALHRRGIRAGLEPAPADGVQVRAVRNGRQVIPRNRDAGRVVPAGAVENLGGDDLRRGRAGGPPADHDDLVPHHRRRAGATRMVEFRPLNPGGLGLVQVQHPR